MNVSTDISTDFSTDSSTSMLSSTLMTHRLADQRYGRSYKEIDGKTDESLLKTLHTSFSYVSEIELDDLPADLTYRDEITPVDPGAIKQLSERDIKQAMGSVCTRASRPACQPPSCWPV